MNNEVLAAFSRTKVETAVERARLVEMTRALRGADDTGRLATLNKTMKAFQREIERLTQRGNFAEEAYLRLLDERREGSPRVSHQSTTDLDAEPEPDADAAVDLDALRAALAESREREGAVKKRALTRVREQKQLLDEATAREAALREQLAQLGAEGGVEVGTTETGLRERLAQEVEAELRPRLEQEMERTLAARLGNRGGTEVTEASSTVSTAVDPMAEARCAELEGELAAAQSELETKRAQAAQLELQQRQLLAEASASTAVAVEEIKRAATEEILRLEEALAAAEGAAAKRAQALLKLSAEMRDEQVSGADGFRGVNPCSARAH